MLTKKLGATLGAAAVGLMGLVSTADAQIYGQPCELCGLAFGAPLPEGVYFIDYESYGQRDGQNNRLGVNEPSFVWSTPFTFYNTRLEILAPDPIFTHIDGSGPGAINRVDTYAPVIIFILAHDFGNDFKGGISVGVHGGDNFTEKGRGANADLRASLSYLKDGWNATVSLSYSGNFGGKQTGTAPGIQNGVFNPAIPQGFDDNLFLDYTLTHTFGKLELGIVGYAVSDIDGPIAQHPAAFAIGGLIGYSFPKFTVQAYATRELAVRYGGYGLGPNYGNLLAGTNGGRETRGYLRFIIPLYSAPTATAPVVAKY